MPRDWHFRLDDMLKAIDHIQHLEANVALEPNLFQLAFERAFEILSEASRHLPPEVKAEHRTIRWQDLADLGNIIRHAYDRVSVERLRETARIDVPPLKLALEQIKKGASKV